MKSADSSLKASASAKASTIPPVRSQSTIPASQTQVCQISEHYTSISDSGLSDLRALYQHLRLRFVRSQSTIPASQTQVCQISEHFTSVSDSGLSDLRALYQHLRLRFVRSQSTIPASQTQVCQISEHYTSVSGTGLSHRTHAPELLFGGSG